MADVHTPVEAFDLDLINKLVAALIEAKRSMWIDARSTWTMADFKHWAVVQQMDEALAEARAAVAKASSKGPDPARWEKP